MADCMFLRRAMKKKKIVAALFIPSSYSVISSSSSSVVTNASNMYDPYTNTSDYATWNVETVGSNYSYVLLGFDLSSIPMGAEINSVTFNIRVTRNDTTGWSSCWVNAGYNGSAKYSNKIINTNSASYLTFSGATWTREELVNGTFNIGASKSSTSTTNHYVYIYGATLTVEYSYYE